jgi:hypothetical protein
MKVIFCIPGRSFSDNWLRSWTETITACSQREISWAMSVAYDPVVYYARNRVLGGNNVDGRHQKPFRGMDYDYAMWIDSDIVWRPDDVFALLNHGLPIVSGCYVMANNLQYPIVEHLDYSKLFSEGAFKFMDRTDLNGKSGLFAASYVGFGFIAVAKSVLDGLEYPWFRPRWVDSDKFLEFTAEDVAFCWNATEQGHAIMVDPSIRVLHEKNMLLG